MKSESMKVKGKKEKRVYLTKKKRDQKVFKKEKIQEISVVQQEVGKRGGRT